MSSINDGGPAFPCKGPPMWLSSKDNPPEMVKGSEANLPGMSLRDWFAGQALSGEMADSAGGIWANDAKDADLYARACLLYRYADAMIAARGGAK